MSISTERGDDGETDLLYGRRVSKTHPRVIAGGAIDELNAALGLVRVVGGGEKDLAVLLELIQRDLINLMGEVALLEEDRERYLEGDAIVIDAEAVEKLADEVRSMEKNSELKFTGWALPGAGGSEVAARLDFARTVCRRAERELAGLLESGEVSNTQLLRYLNRLSDLCWLLARRAEM
jgi:cob(I)alamin adenosyltransferase